MFQKILLRPSKITKKEAESTPTISVIFVTSTNYQ